ncbi:MAG: amidohydrolase [Candidatus Eisenbacteria bacterium]|nr:amidohydrolase [Candidatus Eisenbacteria bacterium]
MIFIRIVFLLIFFVASSVFAQERPIAVKGATIYTVTKGIIVNGTIIFQNGKIKDIGNDLKLSKDVEVVDGTGRVVIPGLVETHSHLGLYSYPEIEANSEGNEATDPITPQLRVIDAFNSKDPAIKLALSGGVTTVFCVPGSANVIGGQGAAFKLWGKTAEEMLIPNSSAMKMAFGENPKRVYGHRNQQPESRMGVAATLREAFTKANNYTRKWETWVKSDKSEAPPDKDLALEALVKVLRREIPVQVHCHRADDIMTIFRLSDEFKFDLQMLIHCTEGYNVADEIAKRKVPVTVFATLGGGGKQENQDMVLENAAFLYKAGVKVAIHNDHPAIEDRYLLYSAAIAEKYGLPAQEALKAITINAAEILRLDKQIGSLEKGKDADVVVLSGDPFDIQSRVERVYVNGNLAYEAD